MRVSDFEVINSIDILFDYPIIIYGAGDVGGKIVKLLECAGLTIGGFCDADKSKKNYCGYEVIHIDDLEKTIGNQSYNIILASVFYFDDMLHQLEKRKIRVKYVFTGWGVEAGLTWNLNHEMVSEKFREVHKRKINELFCMIQKYSTCI